TGSSVGVILRPAATSWACGRDPPRTSVAVVRQVEVRRFDLVPVGIAHEATVIGGAIVGARPRSAVRARAGGERCGPERVDVGLARREEGDVRAVPRRGGAPVERRLDPELRILLAV